MKRIYLILLLLAIATQLPAQNGVIREMSGEVELKHSGSSSFTAASAGDTVAANTIISTGFRSTAIIVAGSSVITVRPLTRLTLAEIQTMNNAENLNFNLQAGRVRVDVKPPSGTKANVKVQSPSSTASVRGTELEIDANNVAAISGKVMVSGTVGPGVIIFGGNSTTVGLDGRPADPALIAAGELNPSGPAGSDEITGGSSSAAPKIKSTDLDVTVVYQ